MYCREQGIPDKAVRPFCIQDAGCLSSLCKKQEEAEEILQEGFLKVFTYINTFQGTGSFEGWIRKIMVNAALFRYRNKAQWQPVNRLEQYGYETVSEIDIASNLDAKELLSLIQSLPAGYRIVFNLFVFEGYKHREIAEELGISEGTSKSNLFDARAFLQKELTLKKESLIIVKHE